MSMPKPVGPYTPIVRVGDFLYSSGQIGLKDGVMVEGFEEQLRQVFANLETVLGSQNSGLDKVFKTTVFLDDIGNYATMNKVYMEYFQTNPPARSAVAVAALPAGAQVEIEAIAYVG